MKKWKSEKLKIKGDKFLCYKVDQTAAKKFKNHSNRQLIDKIK